MLSFVYLDLNVELVVEKFSDEILALNCFKSIRKPEPFLHQMDISEINVLTSKK